MSDQCRTIHYLLTDLPLIVINSNFDYSCLPSNGIYFFFERGQFSGHESSKNRIVRVGTHKQNNFRSRIRSHYVLRETQLTFAKTDAAPHDNSIFRNHIGRCLLRNENDSSYIDNVWKKNKTPKKVRENLQNERDIEKEMRIERQISEILLSNFTFKYIVVNNENDRIGSGSLESALIATLAQCNICKPSNNWLGSFSPVKRIRESGLWNVQHVQDAIISDMQLSYVRDAVRQTLSAIQ